MRSYLISELDFFPKESCWSSVCILTLYLLVVLCMKISTVYLIYKLLLITARNCADMGHNEDCCIITSMEKCRVQTSANDSCYCDSDCYNTNDCCPDIQTICPQITGKLLYFMQHHVWLNEVIYSEHLIKLIFYLIYSFVNNFADFLGVLSILNERMLIAHQMSRL